MRRIDRITLLLGLVWYISILAFAQIFVFNGDRIEAELEFASNAGPSLGAWNFVAILPFLFIAYIINITSIGPAIRRSLLDKSVGVFIWTVICTTLFHAAYQRDLRSFLYSMLLVAAIPAFAAVWRVLSDKMPLVFASMAVSLGAYLCIVPLMFGAPDARYYGSIHPNTFGGVALCASICTLLSGKPYLRVIYLIAFVGAFSVDSRFAMLGIFIVVFGPALVKSILARGGIRLNRMAYLAIALTVGTTFALNFTELFAVSDTERGLAEGITGRFDLWQLAIEYIKANPWGYGFKNSYDMTSGHNGFLNLVLSFGDISATVMVLVFANKMRHWWQEHIVALRSSHNLVSADQALGLFFSFFALLIGDFFQPQIINFGDPVGVLFLLLLSQLTIGRAVQPRSREATQSLLSQGRPL